MKRIVTGILAHVDSGKTTLSEGMLYLGGEIRKLGRVDHKNAFLDTDEIEKDRGITIFSKQAVLNFEDTEFILLDTPGHVDFSPETERTLQVLDYAILVISGTDGVQSHTETLWRLLIRYNIPVFIFINKMDISNAERKNLMSEIKHKLDDGCVNFCRDEDEEFFEELAMCDEDLMHKFLETERLEDFDISIAIKSRKIFPCYFGSALKLEGVKEFMSQMARFSMPMKAKKEFGARVFKIAEGEQGKRLTYMKITGGRLNVKDLICGKTQMGEEWSEKINQIRIYSGAKFKTVNEAEPGAVCAVTGLTKTYPGEGLGFEKDRGAAVLEPVLSYSVELEDGVDVHKALADLKKLEEEDPQLHVVWNEQLQEIHMQLMGEVQLEVLKRIIKKRFNMDISFGQGSIAYKETIAEPIEGAGHYEPLRHYAEVHLLLEPLEQGSGLVFDSVCPLELLDRNWQRLILTHLEEKTHLGVLTGSPITDMKITLTAGRAHQKHTEGGDFRQATYRALRQGLRKAKSVLLEPWYSFKLVLPTENVGRAMTDIQQMGGDFVQPQGDGEVSILSGNAPVDKMRGYHSEVTGYTHGKGRLYLALSGYKPCVNSDEIIDKIGYDCDGDLENTADSVFCSHGAGFAVPWYESDAHMHTESGIDLYADEEKEDINEVIGREYERKNASDKELMQIFERTYGKIDNEPREQMRVKKIEDNKIPKKYKAKPLPKGPEYLLVDGYNIIFAWDELKSIAKDSLEAARNRLVDILCNYQGYKQCELILVFDAYKVKGGKGSVEKINNINVVYTKEAETADMYIERTTHEIGKKRRVRVATSDNVEQIIILANGAIRVSAEMFGREVSEAQREISGFTVKE